MPRDGESYRLWTAPALGEEMDGGHLLGPSCVGLQGR